MRKSIKLQTSIIAAFIFTILLTFSVFGQNVRKTDYKADQVLKSNARVNPSTQAMELTLPIGGYAGRGETGIPIVFNYSSKVWQIKAIQTWESLLGIKTDTRPVYGTRSAAGWTSNLGVPRIDYTLGIYEAFHTGSQYDGQAWSEFVSIEGGNQQPNFPLLYIKRVQVTMPDGSSHEFRKDDSIYDYGTAYSPGGAGLPDQIGTFLSVDGSKMRLELSESASTLFLPDGSRYLFGAKTTEHKAYAYIDRNGNQMTYDAANKRWTDSMGRVVNDPMPMNWGDSVQTQTVGDTQAGFPSFNGATMNITFSWRYLKDPQGGESGLENTSDTLHNLSSIGCQGSVTRQIPAPYLFTNPDPSTTRVCNPISWSGLNNWSPGPPFNPVVLTKITLSNGQTYMFKYNVYGEIIKIIYPTGAYERFNYGAVPPVQSQGNSYNQANRGVIDRWVSAKGDGTDEVHWTYQANGVIVGQQLQSVTTTAPDGTKTVSYVYTELPDTPQPFGFGNAKTGFPYEERLISSTNQILLRKLTSYEVSGAQAGGYSGATRDLRPNKEVTIIFEPGSSSALATMSETIYDNNADPEYFAHLNPKQVKSHNFIVLDLSTAQNANIDTIAAMFSNSTVANISEMDYLYDANYKSRNLISLPIETRLKNAAGTVQSVSQIIYDQSAFPILNSGGTVGWTDPNTNFRGNPTTARSWLNTNNSWIETHVQYDNFGNVRKTWDAKGNVSEVEYSPTYHFAYPTKTKSPIPDPSGQNGSSSLFESNTTFDLVTRLPLTTTDANGQVTTMQYNDPLLRPTRVIPPNGGSTSEMIYNDTPGNIWVKTRTQIDGTNWKEAIGYADNLGRAIKTQSIDNQGDVFSETVYDNMGRAFASTNPYRNGETKLWTQTNFDTAGRPKEVVTPDGAKVQTVYDISTSGLLGTVVTVTDQAGKQRRSVTNALGQLVRVDEPNDAGSLGAIASPVQPTSYSYDTLNNLVQVNQGVQQRNFSYNSLSRLLSATNPESGTINYVYDQNGNLTQKTDARGVVTNYVYDNLNRVVNRNYSDGTPAVSYKYDNLQFAKGRIIQATSAISTTNYNSFDNLGRVLASQQITEGQTYNFGYSYNLSGMLVNQTYPSGRVMTNQFETDGDLAQVNGSYSGQNKTYVNNFSYTSAGAVGAMQLGNGKWENTVFNSRLQPIQIGLGNSQNTQELWKVNYDYGTTDNNGNVKSQQITVPSQFTAVQNYSYDSLNRLKSANETISGSETWKQTFTFDRYGNRKFDANQTTTLGGCPVNVCNPDINPNNNRVTTHQFDNGGNTTVDAEGKQFFYDAENKQKEVKNAQGVTIGQYLYDGDGKRVKKLAANDTTIFVYDASGKLAAEYAITTATPQAPQTSYLTNDTLGSPRVTTDSSGNVVSRRDFRPYGEEIARANYGTDKVRQKFTGYERDNESGLDYAKARMFGSGLGRFTSPDNFLNDTHISDTQSWNLYVYARNNPLILTDPNGEKIYVGNVTGDDRTKLLERANFTYGCESCVDVDDDGYLRVNTTGLSDDIVKAAQFFTDAINSTDPSHLFSVEVTNNSSEVAFGDSRAGSASVNVKGSDGVVRRTSAIRIRLDFGDDDKIQGNSEAKSSFLNLVFAHEVSHFYPSHRQDPTVRGERGVVDNPINEIRLALGIPLRAEYVAGSFHVGGLSYLKFGYEVRNVKYKPIRGTDGIEVHDENAKIIIWNQKKVKE